MILLLRDVPLFHLCEIFKDDPCGNGLAEPQHPALYLLVTKHILRWE